MKCPHCDASDASMSLEPVTRLDHEPEVFAVLCDACGAPLHFVYHDMGRQLSNLVLMVEDLAKAMAYIPDAIEKVAPKPR